jgi:hypothetical protein
MFEDLGGAAAFAGHGRRAAWRLACPGGLMAAGAPVLGTGQVARTQAPPRRVRPFPARLRRFSAAVRRLSQAWFLAVPR